MRRSITRFAIILCLAGSPGALALAQDSSPGLAHANFEAPALRAGIGTSHLAISSEVTDAQRYFDQGISLLHGYDWLQAYRAFKQVAVLDPETPLAYWGINRALSGWGAPELEGERQEALNLLRETRHLGDDREQYYVKGAILRDSLGGTEGKDAEIEQFEALLTRYPKETEAKLFLAREVGWRYNADGTPTGRTGYAVALLENVLASNPDHVGLHHYWIHAVELYYPERALASALKLRELAPGIGHLIHMSGHLFYSLGRYQDARDAFEEARGVEETNRINFDLLPADNPLEVHNLAFLATALAETGQLREARSLARKFADIEMDLERPQAPGIFTLFYQARVLPGRVEWRFGNWEQAAIEFERIDAEASVWTPRAPAASAYRSVLLAFARGMAAVEKGDLQSAERHSLELDAALWVGLQEGQLEVFNGWLKRHLVPTSYELKGAIQARRGDFTLAIELLRQAVDAEAEIGKSEPPFYPRPAGEHLGNVLLAAGELAEARRAFQAVLEHRPNSAPAFFGIARTFEEEGDVLKAKAGFAEFLSLWSGADETLPQMRYARSYASSNNDTR